MKISKIFITLLLIIGFVGITGCQTSPTGVTKLGNPPDSEQPQDPKSFTAKYVSDHPYWKGSVDSLRGFAEDVWLIEFDSEKNIATINSLDNPTPIQLEYQILDDGSISTIAGQNLGVELSATINYLSNDYPLDVELTFTDSGTVIDMFASSNNDPNFHANFTEPRQMCIDLGAGPFDVDADLMVNGDYFVSAFVLIDGVNGECSLAVYDHCASNNLLAEIIKVGEAYGVEYVQCECRSGRCVDSNEEIKVLTVTPGINLCDVNSKVCHNYELDLSSSEPTGGGEEPEPVPDPVYPIPFIPIPQIPVLLSPWWGTTEISIAGDFNSVDAVLSNDGKVVVYASEANNLVPGDSSGTWDVFLRNLKEGTTEKISVNKNGGNANGGSFGKLSISGDGNKVVFTSNATDLVSGATIINQQVYVRLLNAANTLLVSGAVSTSSGNNISKDPSISGDGKYITFETKASNLVTENLNGHSAIILNRFIYGTLHLVSKPMPGKILDGDSKEATFSANDRYIVFTSDATTLINGDVNDASDIFIYDAVTDKILGIASISISGKQGNGDSSCASISSDGRYIAFQSFADDLTLDANIGKSDIYVYDRVEKQIELITEAVSGVTGAAGNSSCPKISGDGRVVVFASVAKNLIAGDCGVDSQVFVHDRETGETKLVSMNESGEPFDNISTNASISEDGRYISFESNTSNFLPSAPNKIMQIYVYDRLSGKMTIASRPE